RTRVPGVLAQANPVAGPLRLWLEDEVGVDVDDIAEVELARADLVGAVRMPQRNAVLAADPRAMRVETARAVGREHGAGVTGAVRSGAREDVVPRFGGEPGEPVAEVVAFERRDGEGLRAAPAAPAAALDVLAIALHHRRDVAVDDREMDLEACEVGGHG